MHRLLKTSSPDARRTHKRLETHDRDPLTRTENRQQRHALRTRYVDLIAALSAPEERTQESSRTSWHRYAEWLTADSSYPLQAAMKLYHSGNSLTGAEIAALVIGYEKGMIGSEILETLVSQSARLPAASTPTTIRRLLRNSH